MLGRFKHNDRITNSDIAFVDFDKHLVHTHNVFLSRWYIVCLKPPVIQIELTDVQDLILEIFYSGLSLHIKTLVISTLDIFCIHYSSDVQLLLHGDECSVSVCDSPHPCLASC